jgi:S-adenosylmethionine:tRNA ribosyltransferase-isomerase
MSAAIPRTRFERAPGTDATEPPEARGVARDAVKLLIARPSGIQHTTFANLGTYLCPGDLLVVNNSATLPAAVGASRTGDPVTVHFSARLGNHVWVVEIRPGAGATGHLADVRPGERIALPAQARLEVGESYPRPGVVGSRLWTARVAVEGDMTSYLTRHGRAIRYAYVPRQWPLSSYQTVFGRKPGGAEMPSAARPFSAKLVTSLIASGIMIAPITLHAGVSSAEPGEAPVAEPFDVSPATARLVNMTRAAGGRVVAVGTTVTRALESAAAGNGAVEAANGWTNLVIGDDRGARVVDGLITGWHDAGASHLLLLEAVAGADLVAHAYREAIRNGYLWHEFGDSALFLPEHRRPRRHRFATCGARLAQSSPLQSDT